MGVKGHLAAILRGTSPKEPDRESLQLRRFVSPVDDNGQRSPSEPEDDPGNLAAARRPRGLRLFRAPLADTPAQTRSWGVALEEHMVPHLQQVPRARSSASSSRRPRSFNFSVPPVLIPCAVAQKSASFCAGKLVSRSKSSWSASIEPRRRHANMMFKVWLTRAWPEGSA
jgi:hypothetical protein